MASITDPTAKLEAELRLAKNTIARAETAASKQTAELQALKAAISALSLAIADRDAQIQAQAEEIERLKAQSAPTEPTLPTTVPPPPQPEGSPVDIWAEDCTRDYYNASLHLAWGRLGGDWIDANGTPWGNVPFATVAWPAGKSVEATAEIDVTELVREHGGDVWLCGDPISIYTRESGRPAALSVTKGGVTAELTVQYDGGLSASTVKDFASADALPTSGGATLLHFDQPADRAIERAVLTVTGHRGVSRAASLAVYVPKPQVAYPQSPVEADGTDADIIMRISGDVWRQGSAFSDNKHVVNADGSLTAHMAVGTSSCGAGLFALPADGRQETIFLRQVLLLHENFTPAIGGKLPGICNTGQLSKTGAPAGGWGGRTANGWRWSCRTNRFPVKLGDKWMGFTPYAYRRNRQTFHGEGNPTCEPLPIGQPFVLDQMVKLNTPDQADGEVAYWLNGVCVGRMTGIAWRDHGDADSLPSEYWHDIYVGGTGYQAPYVHSLTTYEAIVSRRLLPFDRAALERLSGAQ